MRVVFTHHIAHRTRRFAIGFIVTVVGFVHRIKDAPMHRFQPVAQVGNGSADDHAHRIIKVRCFHLGLDRHGRAVMHRALWCFFLFVFRGFWRVVHVIFPSVSDILYIVPQTISEP